MAIVLSACSFTPNEAKESASSNKADWLLIEENMGKSDNVSTFKFMGKDMNVITKSSVETGQDIAYKYYDIKNNMYYKSGPGGLVSINLKNKDIKHLIKDKNINNVYVDNDKIYYYENVGQVENHYQVNICELGTESCLNLPYFVNGFIAKDDILYVVNAKDDENDKPTIQMYENNKLKTEMKVNDSGTFYRYNDSIYYIMIDGMLNVNTQKFTSFVDTNEKSIQLESTFEAFYQADTSSYFVSHYLDSLKLYTVKSMESDFKLKDLNLELSNIIDYEFEGKHTFTFMNKNRQFYSYDTLTNKLVELNIPKDDLNSTLLRINL